MAIIKRNRTLRPSSRAPQSIYKIDTRNVGIDDTLYVTITHEDSTEFKEVYTFEGKDLVDKNSIHFSYQDERIEWLDNLIYNKADTIYKKEENNDITPIIKRKTTKKEKKSFRCPYCGSENKLQEEQIKSRYLNCGWCNNTVENPFYEKTVVDFVKDNFWKIFFITILFAGMINAAIEQNSKAPTKSTSAKENRKQINTKSPITLNQTKQDDSKELVVIDGVAKTYDALPRSEYDIINRWQETNMGEFSKECRIERLKKDGSYRICIGGIYYTCKPGTITNDSKIVFHDANVNNGNYFNLSKGTPVYYIPRMDDSWQEGIYVDGILVLEPNGSANIYMNDIDHRIFEIFTRLRPIY